MICTSSLGECPLERVGDIGIFHEVHEAGVKNACEKFAEAASDGNWAVIGQILFGAFFVESGDICLFPLLGEGGSLVYMVD